MRQRARAGDQIGGAYSSLELDLETGARGSRQEHVVELLRRLTGAEAALVVNNNAAAVLLAVAALAEGRGVIVSAVSSSRSATGSRSRTFSPAPARG